MSKPEGLAAYITVTAAYWAFMLTDGALRMLVLLHFHTLGFSPIQLAYLFVVYELAGMIANLAAGWIAARFGLSTTLYAGLALQIAALIALSQLNPNWTVGLSVIFVMSVQGLSGVAKDLAKMSSKSAVKLLAPKNGNGLFRWVAVLTGSKNAVKGLGFLLGAALLAIFGFKESVWAMAVILAVIFTAVMIGMPSGLPRGRKEAKFREVIPSNRNVNWLSVARVFLFGARDVWFVVGIPIYFHAVLSDGSETGARFAFFLVGGFMAVWVILYGAVQASAPKLLKSASKSMTDTITVAQRFCAILLAVPLVLAFTIWMAGQPTVWLTVLLVLGLLVFGALFAINSALHSYLILAFTHDERVTMDVGFYYMANATGRLVGTALSGASYQIGGLTLCLTTATVMLLFSYGATKQLRVSEDAKLDA